MCTSQTINHNDEYHESQGLEAAVPEDLFHKRRVQVLGLTMEPGADKNIAIGVLERLDHPQEVLRQLQELPHDVPHG